MSAESEAADLAVREGMAIAESAAKLAALGAKNLAALVMALATDSGSLTGKTQLKALVKEGREPLIFSLNERDLRAFTKEAKKYGFPFSVIKSKDSNMLEIIARHDDVTKINHSLSNIGYGDVSRAEQEQPGKNEKTRAPSTKESKERGTGLKSQEAQTMPKPEIAEAPGELISTKAKPLNLKTAENGERGIEALGAETLAIVAASLLSEEVGVFEKENIKSYLAEFSENNREPLSFSINAHDAKAFAKEAKEQGISYCKVSGDGKNVHILANAAEMEHVRVVLDKLGYAEPTKEAPEKEPPKKRGRPPKEKDDSGKSSVVGAIDAAKKQLKEASAEKPKQKTKNAPERGM